MERPIIFDFQLHLPNWKPIENAHNSFGIFKTTKSSIKPPTEKKHADSNKVLANHEGYQYIREPSGRIKAITTLPPDPKIEKILIQVQKFLDKHENPKSITVVPPDYLAHQFWKLYKQHSDKEPLTVVDWIVGSLESDEEVTSEEED